MASNLSRVIAIQIGKVESNLQTQLQTATNGFKSEFSNRCPTVKRLNEIVDAKNTLQSNTGNLRKKVSSFSKLLNRLKPLISTLKTLISLYKSLPLPITIGVPPPTGGVVYSQTLGNTNTSADRLRGVSKMLEELEADIESGQGLIDGSISTVATRLNTLSELDPLIESCLDSYTKSKSLSETDRNLLDQLQDKLTQNNITTSSTVDVADQDKLKYTTPSGTLLFLEIRPVKTTSTLLKRQAIAKNSEGVIMLKGAESFSSSTDVLLDELKFRIDNQLP